MNSAARSLVSTGDLQHGNSTPTMAAFDCPAGVEVWGALQVWSADGTAPTSGNVSVGAGVFTQTGQGNGSGPMDSFSFLTIPFGSVKAGESNAPLAVFYGQVPPGLVFAIGNTTDKAITYRVWYGPRVLTTVQP